MDEGDLLNLKENITKLENLTCKNKYKILFKINEGDKTDLEKIRENFNIDYEILVKKVEKKLRKYI